MTAKVHPNVAVSFLGQPAAAPADEADQALPPGQHGRRGAAEVAARDGAGRKLVYRSELVGSWASRAAV